MLVTKFSAVPPRADAPGPVSAEAGPDLIDLAGILRAIRRNLWLLLAVTALFAGMGYVYAFHVATPLYRATATVVLDTRDTDFIGLDSVTDEIRYDDGALQTEVAILQSQEVLRQVVERLGLLEDSEFNPYLGLDRAALSPEAVAMVAERTLPDTVATLRNALQVGNVPGTYVFSLSALTADPAKSRDIANALAEVYLDWQLTQKIETTRNATEWLSVRLEELHDELIAGEARIENFAFSADSADRLAETVALERLAGEVQATRELYQHFLTRLKETAAQEGLHRPDSRVLSQAVLPAGPAAPRKKVILFFATMLGGILGLGLVFLRETLSDGLHTPRALEAVAGRPLLGATPYVRRRGRRAPAPGLIGTHDRLYGTAIEDIRTNLMMMSDRDTPRTIALTSCFPREGKTALAMSLAASYAAAGARVLLVDADLRQRAISRHLAPDAEAGLVALWRGNRTLAGAVHRERTLQVDVLACETAPEKPVDLLYSDRFRDILAEARGSYGIILLDSSPVLAVPDVRALGPHVDTLLFLAKHGTTSAAHVAEGIDTLERAELRPAGVVMTQVPAKLFSQSRYGMDRYGPHAETGTRASPSLARVAGMPRPMG